ncbi:MAG: hypothetical protein ACN6NT_11200 [Comamonas sp.]
MTEPDAAPHIASIAHWHVASGATVFTQGRIFQVTQLEGCDAGAQGFFLIASMENVVLCNKKQALSSVI